MMSSTRITTAADFLLALATAHPGRDICPGCRESCAREDLARVVYSFEECHCAIREHTHRTEATWHRWCFVKANTREKNHGNQNQKET